MAHYRVPPTYETPFSVNDNIHVAWWRWVQDTEHGAPPSNELPITPTGSPFTYSAQLRGNLIVSGGTVSVIEFSRSGTFYLTGLTAGMFNMAQNDQIQITYSVAPTVVFVPT